MMKCMDRFEGYLCWGTPQSEKQTCSGLQATNPSAIGSPISHLLLDRHLAGTTALLYQARHRPGRVNMWRPTEP